MWAWVLSGPCHLGLMVPSRVAGVAVSGRDLNLLLQSPTISYDDCRVRMHPVVRMPKIEPVIVGSSRVN